MLVSVHNTFDEGVQSHRTEKAKNQKFTLTKANSQDLYKSKVSESHCYHLEIEYSGRIEKQKLITAI